MQKYVPYIFVLLFAASIAACGGSGSTTAATAVYDLPASLASYPSLPNTLMGGSVQGTSLNLSNTVSSLAGTAGSKGFNNYSGNSSVTATFNQPTEITTDGTDFYVTDYGNSLIRRIYTDTVSNEVRTSTLQFIDSDSGANINFYHPTGITTNGTYLYVADSGYNCIRVITLAVDPATNKHKVTTIGKADQIGGSVDSTDVTAVRFNQPIGITTDGKSLYVTDFNNATVRRIDITTKAVSTLAGTSGAIGSTDGTQGAARFNRPGRITTDGKNLYLTDFYNRTIRQIVISTGAVTTIAGSPGPLGTDQGTLDGTGTAARFNLPNGITTDGTYLYVTDSFQNIIRKINISTGTVTTIPLPGGSFHTPVGITTDGISLFVADTYTVYRDPKTYVDTYTYSNSILKIQ